MNDGDAKTLMAKLDSWSRKKRFRSDSDREDFVMYAVEEHIRGRETSSYHQLYVDFLRLTVAGRATGPHYEERLAAANQTFLDGAIADTTATNCPSSLDALERKEAMERAMSLRGPSRAILLLHVFYGFTEVEIADIFGVTESRVSQKLTAFKRIRSYLEQSDCGSDFPLEL